jgi:hypothetical protein
VHRAHARVLPRAHARTTPCAVTRAHECATPDTRMRTTPCAWPCVRTPVRTAARHGGPPCRVVTCPRSRAGPDDAGPCRLSPSRGSAAAPRAAAAVCWPQDAARCSHAPVQGAPCTPCVSAGLRPASIGMCLRHCPGHAYIHVTPRASPRRSVCAVRTRTPPSHVRHRPVRHPPLLTDEPFQLSMKQSLRLRQPSKGQLIRGREKILEELSPNLLTHS